MANGQAGFQMSDHVNGDLPKIFEETPTEPAQVPAQANPEALPGTFVAEMGAANDMPPHEAGPTPDDGDYSTVFNNTVPRCTAKSKQRGQRCRNPAMPGRTVCRFHGGTQGMGVANPGFKHGRFSKILPKGIRKRYEAALNDPGLLSAREEIAMLTARVEEIAGRLTSGETAELWREIRRAHAEMESALASRPPDQAALRSAMARIKECVTKGATEQAVWDELQEAIERKSKVSAREHKMMVDQQQMLTTEESLTFVMSVMASVRRHVHDRNTLRSIGDDLSGLLQAERAKG